MTAVPNLLLRYQGRLGLTSNEVIYLQHVLMHRWEETWPWVAASTIVAATGAAERSVRDWKASLVAKNLLVIRTRGRGGGGRGADEHDLSKLFAALEALALEEEMQRATADARQGLPTPMYFRGGLAGVPQVSTSSRRKLQTERVRPHASKAAENRRIEAAENRRSNLPEPAALLRQLPASEEEALDKRPPQEPTREEKTGLAAAARPPGSNDTAVEFSSSNERRDADDDLVPAPGYYDDGVSTYVDQWTVEFGDNDPQRSLEQAHHIWWNSKLPRWEFHMAMKAARHETARQIDANKVFGAPMAYAFKVLGTEVAQRRERMGLGRTGDASDQVDDAVELADADRPADASESDRVSPGYDKAQIRERLWRRVSPEERAVMWEMGSAEDRAAYRELVTQGLDWPGAAEVCRRVRRTQHRRPQAAKGTELDAFLAEAAAS